MPKVLWRFARAGMLAVCLLTLMGCDTLGHTGSRIVGGSAIGAATGAVATVLTGGCIPCGAAIGAGAGAGAGYVFDRANRVAGR